MIERQPEDKPRSTIHDRIVALVVQAGHPDWSLKEMIESLRRIAIDARRLESALSSAAPTTRNDAIDECRDAAHDAIHHAVERMDLCAFVKGYVDEALLALKSALPESTQSIRQKPSAEDTHSEGPTPRTQRVKDEIIRTHLGDALYGPSAFDYMERHARQLERELAENLIAWRQDVSELAAAREVANSLRRELAEMQRKLTGAWDGDSLACSASAPTMPRDDEIRLAMGELTPDQMRTARAAIRWTLTRSASAPSENNGSSTNAK